jgi:hypothetical protein
MPPDGQTARSLGIPACNQSRFPFERPVESPSQLDCADATDANCGNSPDGSGVLFRRCWHRQPDARRVAGTRLGASRRTVTSVLGPESGRGFHLIRIGRRLVGLVLLLPGRHGKAQAAREVTPRFLKKSSTPPCRESPWDAASLQRESVTLDSPLAVPDFEQIRRSSREHERRSLRNGCVELLTACGEGGGIRPRSQREIPAAVPAHT